MIQHNKKGYGLVNTLINKLPIELHIPGYHYCGPGTKLSKRLAEGDPGINPLDSACKDHGIAYSKNRENIQARHAADKIVENKAYQRIFARDASFGEKAAAYAITNTMKVKRKLGMGLKNKVALKKIIKVATSKNNKNKLAKDVIQTALQKARKYIKNIGGKSKVILPRILPVSSKVGGFLPFLVPLFAGLSATGALAGGAAGVAKAVNAYKSAQKQLEESQRHNKTMEAIAFGKGLYLKPYKKGFGLYLKPYGNG